MRTAVVTVIGFLTLDVLDESVAEDLLPPLASKHYREHDAELRAVLRFDESQVPDHLSVSGIARLECFLVPQRGRDHFLMLAKSFLTDDGLDRFRIEVSDTRGERLGLLPLPLRRDTRGNVEWNEMDGMDFCGTDAVGELLLLDAKELLRLYGNSGRSKFYLQAVFTDTFFRSKGDPKQVACRSSPLLVDLSKPAAPNRTVVPTNSPPTPNVHVQIEPAEDKASHPSGVGIRVTIRNDGPDLYVWSPFISIYSADGVAFEAVSGDRQTVISPSRIGASAIGSSHGWVFFPKGRIFRTALSINAGYGFGTRDETKTILPGFEKKEVGLRVRLFERMFSVDRPKDPQSLIKGELGECVGMSKITTFKLTHPERD